MHEFRSKGIIIHLVLTEIDIFLRIGYISLAILAVPFYFGCSYLLFKKIPNILVEILVFT